MLIDLNGLEHGGAKSICFSFNFHTKKRSDWKRALIEGIFNI